MLKKIKNSLRIKNLKFKISLLLASFFLFLASSPVASETMRNGNYILQWGNFNTIAGTSESDDYRIGITAGQTAPGLFEGPNYKVRSGFQYVHSIIPFSFSISGTLVDFGTLSPTNPVTRFTNLVVSNGSAFGYQVTATESSQLRVPASGAIIPDTTCDGGTCTEIAPGTWTSNLTYGFGYRCDNVTGTDCSTDFSDPDNYKQFPDASLGESQQPVMIGTNVGREKEARVTYKVNVSGTQPAGFYTNVVTYIATPTY